MTKSKSKAEQLQIRPEVEAVTSLGSEHPNPQPNEKETTMAQQPQVRQAEAPAHTARIVAVTISGKTANIDMSKYDGLPSISAKIRSMRNDGYTTSQISKALGKIYQHVRNVLTQKPKTAAPMVAAGLPADVKIAQTGEGPDPGGMAFATRGTDDEKAKH